MALTRCWSEPFIAGSRGSRVAGDIKVRKQSSIDGVPPRLADALFKRRLSGSANDRPKPTALGRDEDQLMTQDDDVEADVKQTRPSSAAEPSLRRSGSTRSLGRSTSSPSLRPSSGKSNRIPSKPSTPASVAHSSNARISSMRRANSHSFAAGARPRVDLELQATLRTEQAIADMRLGLQVTCLGAPAPKLRLDMQPRGDEPRLSERKPALADVCNVFAHFCRLKSLEPPSPSGPREERYARPRKLFAETDELELEPLEHPESGEFDADGGHVAADPLSPISWSTFIRWIEEEAEFGTDPSYRRACAGLARGSQLWRKLHATPSQRKEGISLGLLLKWVYPSSKDSDIAQMLSLIGRFEMEKLRQPSPRLIDSEEREQLERIFKSAYANGRQFTTADDLAGGWNPDKHTQLHTLVDADLAHSVFGEAEIDLLKYLELMCDGRHRGHEDVKRVSLPGGKPVILSCRQLLNFKGWVYEDPPREELSQRRVIDGLEREVLRWRSGHGY